MKNQQLELSFDEGIGNNRLEESLSYQQQPSSQKKFKRKYKAGKDFYVPPYAYQVRKWLYNYCKIHGKEPRNFREMRARQLYAIYKAIRIRELERAES